MKPVELDVEATAEVYAEDLCEVITRRYVNEWGRTIEIAGVDAPASC